MIVTREILGNVHSDPELGREAAEWAVGGRVEWVSLDVWQAQKARLRLRASGGTDLGCDLPRGTVLRSGDVLFRDAAWRHLVIVEVAQREVLVIRLLPQPPEAKVATALKLGHLLGNQHWPVRLVGDTAYVPVLIDRNVMRTVLQTHALDGITFAFEAAPTDLDLPLIFPSLEGRGHGHHHDAGGA